MSENKIEELQRELLGVTEMLGFVLAVIAEPVVVPNEMISNRLPEGLGIRIDQVDEGFVFYLAKEVEDDAI